MNKKNNFFYLYGDSDKLNKEITKYKINKEFYEIINTNKIISDEESPLNAAKKGEGTSMWNAIDSQKKNISDISLSAGNTGALLVISRLLLDTLEKIERPALAGLWPNSNNMSVVLDLGANIECNAKNLIDFCSMGSALHKALFKSAKPKIALLNVGLEENKGNEVVKKTFSKLKELNFDGFDFCGHIEGSHIMDGDVDVIVTDGFTGNIALKTAEGTANFITKNLGKSLNKLSMAFSYSSLKKFKDKLDPRKYNGAILLGLQSPVVKSHGSTDALGFSFSIDLCHKIVKANIINKIKNNLILDEI